MGKVFDLKAGERARVLWIFSSSIPGMVRFHAKTETGEPPQGTIELAVRRWFAWDRKTFPLSATNRFDKGFSDADYRIYVTADTDCRIEFETRHFRAEIFFRILAGILILGVLSAAAAFLFAPSAP